MKKTIVLAAVVLCAGAVYLGRSLASLGECSNRSDQLRRLRVHEAKGDSVSAGRLSIRPPPGSFIRTDSASISVFKPHFLFCDSGDWGVNPGDQVRVTLYDLAHTDSAILEDIPADQINAQRDAASIVATVPDTVVVRGRAWRRYTKIWRVEPRRVRSIGMIADYPSDAECCRVAITWFSAIGGLEEDLTALDAALQSITLRAPVR